MPNEYLEAALSYLKRGWSVVPGHGVTDGGFCTCRQDTCDRPGKHPRVNWGEYRDHRASEADLRRWYSRRGWEESSVIIITGQISGLVVLDVDPRHGGDESLRDWEREHGELPRTPRSLTGGGGTHYLFAYPEGISQVETTVEFLPGLDTRADGNGYIMAPPSTHASGRPYAWDSDAHVDDVDLAPWPKDLHDAVTNRYRGGLATGRKGDLDISGIITGTVKVPEGSRNQALASVVGFLVYANPEDQDVETIFTLSMGVVERSFDPPLDPREVRRTVESILRRNDRRRQADARATQAVRNIEVKISAEDMDTEERVDTAASLWKMVGVETVTDWYALVDAGSIEYLLITPEDEIRLGTDLLDYTGIHRVLFNHAGIQLTSEKRPKEWGRTAFLLRQLVRVEHVESSRASEQVDEWIEDYLRARAAQIDPEPGMRREWMQSAPIVVEGELWIRPQLLARFIEVTYGDRLESRRVAKMLRRAGWESGTLADGSGSSIRGWHKGAK